MVRFSCFLMSIHHHKYKKEVHQTAETMSKAHHDYVDNQAMKFSSCLNPVVLKESYDKPSEGNIDKAMHSSSQERCDAEVRQRAYLKKSQSVGSHLNREMKAASDDGAENEIDQGYSDGSNGNNSESQGNESAKASYWENEVEMFEQYDTDNSFNQFYPDLSASLIQEKSVAFRGESIFSIGDEKHVEELRHKPFVTPSERVSEFGVSTPLSPRLEKSCSLPNVGTLLHSSENGSPSQLLRRCRSKSFEDLDALKARRKEILNAQLHAMEGEGKENDILGSKNIKCDGQIPDGYDGYGATKYERYSTISEKNGESMNKHESESGVQNREELQNAEFKMKRIEEWVSKIDIGDSHPLDITNETPQSSDMVKKVLYVWNNVTNGKFDPKNSHGVEAAKHYISSLTATSTVAQLNNLGLVVIPFLSAFVSLKVLNLSGNSIVRITAGALPRGLHALNLSKNNISNIEGLRELGRLRVLDLSYNRILRIGHGLASCSSLKELYLAGNKISEVEGLHRLLKLNILDLRFNKISTAKCLGQLAANYASLHSLNLEGNPAQTNVGDEQLKKYLHSLLPHLVYYNKHHLRASSSKESAERSARSALTSHQSERSLRSEHKLIRKGINSAAAIGKGLPSSSQGLRGHSVRSPKRNKDHHGRLPPAGTRGSHHHRHHFAEVGSKLPNLRLGDAASMRKSRSEEFLGFS